jgi:hypothetical protein
MGNVTSSMDKIKDNESPSEKTPLFLNQEDGKNLSTNNVNSTTDDSSNFSSCKISPRYHIGLVFLLLAIGAGIFYVLHTKISHPTSTLPTELCYKFPDDFVWGAATSSYQIEGATQEGGRGLSIWDTFCKGDGNIVDGSNGNVSCDHYHRVHEDVQLMKNLGLKAYRFSILWPRIYPNGNEEMPNLEGIEFYNKLINELLANGIEPWVTLYH